MESPSRGEGKKPEGTLLITTDGTYDVTIYKSVTVMTTPQLPLYRQQEFLIPMDYQMIGI